MISKKKKDYLMEEKKMINEKISSDDIYNAFLHGADQVISNVELLNKINVFPIQDGDTGNNLASLMKTIIDQSEKEATVKATLTSFSDAAIHGARGNSGIIFAQYLNGLSLEMEDLGEVDYKDYALASQKAVRYAYESIESPVEGTILTVMNEWGEALWEQSQALSEIKELMKTAINRVDEALSQTQFQLMELKKAKVVDAGAKGFTLFVQGISEYFMSENKPELKLRPRTKIHIENVEVEHDINAVITHRYCTEALIEGSNLNQDKIKEELSSLGDSLVVAGNERLMRVHIHSNNPEKVFGLLYEEGNITYQKVDDMVKQQDLVLNRKYDTALLTDSIADLPQKMIDDEQIHIINLNILFGSTSFLDKLTITNERILEYSKDSESLPSSSQPDEKQIENILNYLSNYYKSLIVITVAKPLSGTFNNISKVAKRLAFDDFKISIIDSKQNSGAQGLLVAKAAKLIHEGSNHDQVVKEIEDSVSRSKILVLVKNLDNMIKSGRLSTTMGKIGKKVGLKPIVTLDKDGDGGLGGIAFTEKGSLRVLKHHIRKVMKNHEIESYNIVHVNNLKEAKEMETTFTELIGKKPNYLAETSSVVAVGAGDQSLALSYILKA